MRRRGAQLLDAHELPFESEFDAVFSNAALHWIKAPSRVVAGAWRALRPGGRFVGEMGGCGNVAAIERPTPLPGDIRDWLETMPQPYTAAVPRAGRRQFVEEVAESLRPLLCDAAGRWTADYVRLRFAAAKPLSGGA